MPLLKAQKKELAQRYLQELQGAKNIVLLKQYGLPVNQMTTLRKGVAEAEGKLAVVKKRVLLKGIEGKFDGVTLDTLEGSVVVLYSYNEADEHAPLKAIHKAKKQRAKEKAEFGFDYLGGWYDSVWQTGGYVSELAGLPSKEELVAKFLFLLNHPVASFARALNAIAEKDGSAVETPVAQESEQTAEEQPTSTQDQSAPEVAPEEPTAEGTEESAPQA